MSRALENSLPEAAPDGLRSEFLPPVAYIETDRYCEHCGYNLRTQPVVREPHTQFLVARCPECGRFHPAAEHTSAGRLWLRRLATLLLFLWIVVVAHAGAGVLLAQGAWGMLTLEELTHYRRVPLTANPAAKTQRYSYTREVDPNVANFGLFMTLILGASAATAGLGGLLARVIVRVVLPPRVRPTLSFLWLVDGKPLPAGSPGP
jgi:hypothetical protein